jgi:hypothetical protein
MRWTVPLAFVITPKSGPLRQMTTLLDANRALTQDLPRGYLKRSHWLRAGQQLVTAAETCLPADNRAAFEEIVTALECEGWMTTCDLSNHFGDREQMARTSAPLLVQQQLPPTPSSNVIPLRGAKGAKVADGEYARPIIKVEEGLRQLSGQRRSRE